MPDKKQNPRRSDPPEDSQPLKGSDRRPPKGAKLLGPADENETFPVSIVLRRRPGAPAVPGFDYFAKTALAQRRRMPQNEFAAKYGASSDDIAKVVQFAQKHSLKVVSTHAARRTVVVSGTVAQMSKAFGVALGRYRRENRRLPHPGRHPARQKIPVETYRGRDGAIQVPKALADIIVGVFGLDNRSITGSSGQPGDPADTSPITIQQATQLYNFPAAPAEISQQTVGIFSPSGGFGGYFQSDLQSFFGASLPQIVPIPVDAANGSIQATTTVATDVGSSSLVFAPTAGIAVSSGIIVGTVLDQLGGLPGSTSTTYGPAVMAVSTTATATTVTIGSFDYTTSTWSAEPATSIIPAGTSVYFNLDNETTQDVCISGAASAASSGVAGANVAVYFSSGSEAGWVEMINRAVHPEPGDFPAGVNPPSVLSSSFYISGGDDPYALADWGVTPALINAVHAAFQDAAIQGVTVCIASGDYGSNCLVGNDGSSGDGKAHVQYPASDPWVLSVGGTTLGGNTTGSPPPWVEFVWNDASGAAPAWGTTGGGVSDFFSLPSYQDGAGVPNSINTTADAGYPPFNTTGRGVPDVAANASYNSGYLNLYFAGDSNWYYGNGTSASAPLWAGFIALINANLGFNVGFVNPILYALGASVFNAINALNPALPALSGCPTNNANSGVPGYPAASGWDACTGWGSPNGTVLLNALRNALTQDCYFILDTGIYDEGAVEAGITASGSTTFQDAVFVVVEGFTANQLGISAATVVNALTNPPTVQPIFTGTPAGMAFSLVSVQPAEGLSASGLNFPQRFTYAYNVTFSSTGAFPTTPAQTSSPTITATVTATISGSPVTVSAGAVFELINQPGPFLAGGSGVTWLSSDIRVFQVEPGEWTVPDSPSSPLGTGIVLGNSGNPTVDATTFIQSVIQSLNSGNNIPPAAADPSPGGPVPSYFDLIPTGEDLAALDLLPIDPATHQPVYNFALARVRYKSAAIAAQNVRAFFRLIPALSVSTAFDPTTTYRSGSAGPQEIPLYGIDSASGDVISIPCFAQARVNAATVSVQAQTDSANLQSIPATGGEVDVYFGCWLDINQATAQYPANVAGLANPDGPFTASSLQSIQTLLRNQHQCLVVELAYAPDPIPIGSAPSTSGPLAQRNLTLGDAANPGESASRSVLNTFTIRATPPEIAQIKADELMIDWGDTPAGSIASIYWPQVSATQVLELAAGMYTAHNLTLLDSNTIQLPVAGITYIPIPPGTSASLPGLISVDLPLGIRKGQTFDVLVRQVTSAGSVKKSPDARGTRIPAWRRVLGSFQLKINVSTKQAMLAPEERSLSVMRWIQQTIPASNRWFPVMQRYVNQIAARVSALGGNPTQILPSPTGGVTILPGGGQVHEPAECLEFSGKIEGLKFDRFGDFVGFLLLTEQGREEWFESREVEVETLAQRAWAERIRISVLVAPHARHRPESIVFRELSRQGRT